MRTSVVTLMIAMAALMFPIFAQSQAAQPQTATAKEQDSGSAASHPVDGWPGPKPAPVKAQNGGPAPRHDISGTWDPGFSGLQTLGAGAIPEDGKPEHRLPYTAAGLEALNRTRPSNGARSVLPTENNDPVFSCDPQGMPREDLYELRTTQIIQTPEKVVMLYQFAKVWRVIWTDGRELPKDPEPRWYGYSVGKWVDDNTLLVETTGTDERTWIDRAGRPHSAGLRIEERFHRVDRDHMELTMTIDDPKMYTKPWVALDKLRFDLQPPDFDVREFICSPSEFAEYNKLVGAPASEKTH
jgi:hypothetical protein